MKPKKVKEKRYGERRCFDYGLVIPDRRKKERENNMSNQKYSPGYYYLHTNGGLVYKPKAVITNIEAEEYFDSPFVAKYWIIKTKEEYEKMIIEIGEMKYGSGIRI